MLARQGLRRVQPWRTPPAPRISRQIASSSRASASNTLRTIAYSSLAVVGTTLFAVYYFDSRSAIHRYIVTPSLRVALDAETGHRFALKVLGSGLAPRDVGVDDESLKTELFGKTLPNPIGLAAGFDKDGEAIDGLFNLGFSWVEIGSVTPKPQPGNPQPRVFHLTEDSALINRYGFPSKGFTALLSRLAARERPHAQPSTQLLSLNLGKNKSSAPDSIADFLKGVRTFGQHADVLVVNVSSPNTPGLRSLQSRGMLLELLDAVVQERDALTSDHLPRVLVKIAPDLTEQELKDIAEVVIQSGIDGVIVSNTTTQRPASLESANRTELGGLSGAPLKSLALGAVKTLRSLLPASVPLVGCGGISSGSDALEFAKAGASAVQLYTAFGYGGVGVPRRIKDELAEALAREGKTWSQVVSESVEKLALKTPTQPDQDETQKTLDRVGKVIAFGEDLSAILKNAAPSDALVPEEATPVIASTP